MKKIIAALIAVLLLSAVLTGCGGGTSDGVKCSDVTEAALTKTDNTKIDTTVGFDEDTYEDNFEGLYNFPIKMVSDGAICYASTGGYADEISIVKAGDIDDVTEIKKYMEARLEQRMQDFQGYKPREVSKIENGEVIVQKQYVVLIIAKDAATIASTIREKLS